MGAVLLGGYYVARQPGMDILCANSLEDAEKMFRALLSPASYAAPVLSESLYLLVAVTAAAYALTLYLLEILEEFAGRVAAEPARGSGVLAIALRERWVWLAPMWAMACVLVLTLIPHQSRAANVFLYRYF